MKLTKTALGIFKGWAETSRYLSVCGGTRSGKTYGILQLIAILGMQRQGAAWLFSVVSESYPHLRRGVIRDFRMLLEREGLASCGVWNKADGTFTFTNGNVVEFFSVENAGKVHGAARDFLFINEAQNVSQEVARQLFVRTRRLVVVDYNPTRFFWINEDLELDARCVRVHSTYKDNDFLTPEQVQEIERNKRNANWWRVYGEGKVGEVEGLVFPDFKTGGGLLPHQQGLPCVVGVDFGFTNDPTAIVEVVADVARRVLYVKELCYERGLLNAQIAERLRGAAGRVICDCAEPKTIAELRALGVRAIPSDKTSKRKGEQLQWLRGWELIVNQESGNLLRELRGYSWAKVGDKYINEPQDGNDHAIDALRYAAFTSFFSATKGRYCVH